MVFRSFQTRVVVAFLALITLVQVGSLIAVDSAIRRSARSHVKAELITAARVFTQVIDARNRRLIEAARILSEDFAFKQVLALSDRATLLSAMDNHRSRIGSDLMMLLSLDNTLIADTSHHEARGGDFAARVGLPKLVEAAQRGGEVATFAVIDDRLYQLVVVPLRAPALMGLGRHGLPDRPAPGGRAPADDVLARLVRPGRPGQRLDGLHLDPAPDRPAHPRRGR